jgi:hypothetical protein
MTRYDDKGPDPAPRKTKMLRVVDAQGYHLRWIEVAVDAEKNRPAGRGPAEKGSCDKVQTT